MNLTIRRNGDRVWAGAEHTQTISGLPLPVRCGFFTPIVFDYGRVACNYTIPFVEKLQARLIASVQAPDQPFTEHRGNISQSGVKIMSNLLSIPFNNSTLVHFTTDGYLNATSIAKSFGKRARDYLINDRTKEYMEAITRILVIDENQLVIIKRGSSEYGGGTWLHPKLAIDFARWLSPEIAVWCDEQIENILNKNTQGQVATVEMRKTTSNPKSRRFYIEISITDNLMGGTVYMKKVAETTNHMVTGFANDLGYRICGLEMIGDAFAEIYKK